MATTKQAVAVYLRVDLVQEVKKRNLNLSALVNQLLEQYLYGSVQNPSEEIVRINKALQELEEIKKVISRVQELEAEIKQLKAELEKEQEAKEIEQNLTFLRLIETEFEDFRNPENLEKHKEFAKKQGTTLEAFIERRLSAIAAKCKVSLPEAWQLFFKVFPDLKEILEA